MNATKKIAKNKGFATIYSLFIAILILTMATGFNWMVREHLKMTFTLNQKMEALVAAYSTYQLFLFSMLPSSFLNKEINLYEGDKYLGLSRLPLNGTEILLNNTNSTSEMEEEEKSQTFLSMISLPVSISLQDTNGLLSLTNFDQEAFDRLLKFKGVAEDKRRIIIDSILDWTDPDDLVRLKGAEKDYYKNEGLPYSPRNYQIQYLEELMLIRGIDEELYKKIEPFVTILPNSGFNPNTAPKDILRAYLDIEDEKTLNNLSSFLENGTILNHGQLFQLTGKALALKKEITFVPSQVLLIKIKVGHPLPLYTLTIGLDLRKKTRGPFEILLWKEN